MVLVLAAALVFCWRGIEQELGQDMNLFLCIALIPFVGLLAWSCRIFFISVPNECSSIAYAVGVLMAREEISESTFELLSESDIRFHITKLLEQSAATWYASRKGADPEKGIDSSDFRILHHIFENAGLLYERFPSYKEKMQAKFWEA
jgi:hypothetical protein